MMKGRIMGPPEEGQGGGHWVFVRERMVGDRKRNKIRNKSDLHFLLSFPSSLSYSSGGEQAPLARASKCLWGALRVVALQKETFKGLSWKQASMASIPFLLLIQIFIMTWQF